MSHWYIYICINIYIINYSKEFLVTTSSPISTLNVWIVSPITNLTQSAKIFARSLPYNQGDWVRVTNTHTTIFPIRVSTESVICSCLFNCVILHVFILLAQTFCYVLVACFVRRLCVIFCRLPHLPNVNSWQSLGVHKRAMVTLDRFAEDPYVVGA